MSDRASNPFASEPAAHRYALGRPYYHRFALQLAANTLGLNRVGLAVDIACGTGLSTRALRDLADRVIAFDAAPPMVRTAPRHPRTQYLIATAERIPLRSGTADLATVAAAFHWFNQPRVLAELARILRPGAALIVYTDFFRGHLPAHPGFTDWFTGAYLPRHPTPRRHPLFDPAAATAAGFTDPSCREADTVIPLTRPQLVNYLLSQSNAATAIESGTTTAEHLRRSLHTGLEPFLPTTNTPTDALFGIRVWTTVRN